MRKGCLDEPDRSEHIRFEGSPQLVRVDVLDAARLGDVVTGVVDEDVKAAESGDHPIDRSPRVRLLAEVPGNRQGLPPLGLDEFAAAAAVLLLLGQVPDGHVGTFPREGQCSGATDAGIPAGDECPPALEPTVSAVAVLSVVGPWIHPFGESRVFLELGRGIDVGPPRIGSVKHIFRTVCHAVLLECRNLREQ